jgi:hypothetical protein
MKGSWDCAVACSISFKGPTKILDMQQATVRDLIGAWNRWPPSDEEA